MREKNNVILHVVEKGLCTGCGTCIAFCPKKALFLDINNNFGIYEPNIEDKRCVECNICLDVCPGHEVNFPQIESELSRVDMDSDGSLEYGIIGKYINCYNGYSCDHAIRYESSSGGLITALLIFALEERIIDGALVTRMDKNDPLKPESFIARTKEEIINASKSKYCPVAANIMLRDIQNSKDGEKFAVVGLPCHIQGLRKAERLFPKLKQKIVLHIGIQCGHTDNFFMNLFIAKWFNIEYKHIKKIDYRGNGWPGSMTITLDNGNKKTIKYTDYNIVHEMCMFTPHRCFLCWDKLNGLSDITFGDYWVKSIKDDIGTSIIVSRSVFADSFLKNAEIKNIIHKSKLSNDEIVNWKPTSIWQRQVCAANNLRTILGRRTPVYNVKIFKANLFSYLLLVLFISENYLASKKFLWAFIILLLPLKRYIMRDLKSIIAIKKSKISSKKCEK